MMPGMGGARRILILAPHPDDEIVACGIAAMRARAAGSRVFVLYLTTGVPPRSGPWRRLGSGDTVRVARRRGEALAAAALLGLEPVGFCATPARQLRAGLDAAAIAVTAAIAECAADALWVPAFEGAHQDHDAANALAATVADALPVWEFAAYNFAGGRVRANRFTDQRGGEIAIQATPAEVERKHRALGCYVSERGNLRHVGAGVGVAREACRPLAVYDSGHDNRAPPHRGRLFRERFQWVPWRHPRVDFDPSAEIYRDLAAWMAARPPRASGASPDRVEAALEEVGGGDAVDDLGAAFPGHVVGDHLAGHRRGRQPLVPERNRQVAQRQHVAGELAHGLGARAVAAGKAQRQPDNEAADAMLVGQREKSGHVIAKAAAPDRVERAGDDEPGIAERQPDRLGPDIETQ